MRVSLRISAITLRTSLYHQGDVSQSKCVHGTYLTLFSRGTESDGCTTHQFIMYIVVDLYVQFFCTNAFSSPAAAGLFSPAGGPARTCEVRLFPGRALWRVLFASKVARAII